MNEVFPEGEKKLINMEYLIEPMSLTAKMTQRNDMTIVNDKDNDKNIQLPKIHLVLELDKFNFDIQKEQYDCIIKIINTVSQYHQILHDFNNTNKFKFYRPRIKLSEALKSKKEDENKNKDKINLVSIDEYKKQIIKEWLKFAGHMIVFQIKYIKKNNKNIFTVTAGQEPRRTRGSADLARCRPRRRATSKRNGVFAGDCALPKAWLDSKSSRTRKA